jgi:hypothetical protein
MRSVEGRRGDAGSPSYPGKVAATRAWVGAAFSTVVLVLVGCSDDGEGQGGNGLAGGESEVLGQADEGIEGVKAIRVAASTGPGSLHTESIVDYDLRPPAGGAHNPVWWNCGFYDEVIPDEHAVHDLEHGVVWLAYGPELPPTDIEVVHDLARAEDKVLASPYPDLDVGEGVVATAWARQLRLESVDDERLVAFVQQYQDGDQAPEAGSTCLESPFGEPIP